MSYNFCSFKDSCIQALDGNVSLDYGNIENTFNNFFSSNFDNETALESAFVFIRETVEKKDDFLPVGRIFIDELASRLSELSMLPV